MKVAKPTGKILFRETQQFRQLWLWAIIISSALLPVVLVTVLTPKDEIMSTTDIIILVAALLGTFGINVVIFYIIKLETVVTNEGLFYRWWPFIKKYSMYPWKEVATITVRKYPYPKYGYHKSSEFGKVHIIDGNKGMLFELVDGKRVYIGTQKLTAFQYAVEQMRPVSV